MVNEIDFQSALDAIAAGHYKRVDFPPEFDDSPPQYLIFRGQGLSIRINGLRLISSPEKARVIAQLLTAWADREERTTEPHAGPEA